MQEEYTEHAAAIAEAEAELQAVIARLYEDLRRFDNMRGTQETMGRILKRCAAAYVRWP